MSRRIEVDSEMLAEGMKITFFGISAVFASMGIPEEAANFLGIRGPGSRSQGRNESAGSDQNPEEERPVPYAADAEDDRPQVTQDVYYENGFGVSFGRLREDTIFDWKLVGLAHNTVRGAAGGAVLSAEALVEKGYITCK